MKPRSLIQHITYYSILSFLICGCNTDHKYMSELRQITPKGPLPIPGNVLAAITAAVNVVTHGKGKITKVEKIN